MTLLLALGVIFTVAQLVWAQADDPAPPAETVKLIFIHHSSGENWLTDPDNHHRFRNGETEYITDQGRDTLYYPTDGDDHPSPTGNQKSTEEFVPLLNVYYHRWQSGAPVVPPPTSQPTPAPPTDTPQPTATATDEPIASQPTREPEKESGRKGLSGLHDDRAGGSAWSGLGAHRCRRPKKVGNHP